MKNTRIVVPSMLVGLACLSGSLLSSSNAQAQKQHYETPNLVVGIIVDQMRPDYIYRYWDKYGEDGIKRLVNDGFSFRNAYFRHMLTHTGPGHAAQLTGATPAVHGLIGNSWYDRELGRRINVIEDAGSGYVGVGASPNYNGEKSPRNMLTTTVGDELFLHTGERSRTVGISGKDRGAILPAGHTGSAYWLEGATGNFITSSFYRDELPGWLREFNDRNLHETYLSRVWEPLMPIEEYVESRADENPYEGSIGGYSTFPIDLPKLVEEGAGPGLINSTPFGNELLLELAFAALEGEELGKREVPDILTISFSAADILGHRFGPASKQVQDYYLRLDRNLARLLDYLDGEFGTENVLVFLTADHGGAYIPHYLRDLGITTGHPDTEKHIDRSIRRAVSHYMEASYGEDFLLSFSFNHYLYLDHGFMDREGFDHEKVRTDIKRFLLTLDPVAGAMTADALNNAEFTEGMRARAQHSFHQKRSGDVVFWLKPQTRGDRGTGGTGHGTGWVYDTHVPLIFYGFDIPHGQSGTRAYVSDIASTLSIYLNSPFPSGNIGDPLNDHMKWE